MYAYMERALGQGTAPNFSATQGSDHEVRVEGAGHRQGNGQPGLQRGIFRKVPRFPLKGSLKGDRDIDVDIHVDMDRFRYGCSCKLGEGGGGPFNRSLGLL